MPWWLIYYVGNYYEIKTFLFVLTVSYFLGGVYLMAEKRRISGFVISAILFAITMLLPDGQTATTIYNSLN